MNKNNTTLQCDHQLQFRSHASFIMNGIVIAAMCICGIIGNIQVIRWLTRNRLRMTNFRIYLTGLCVSDSFALLSALCMLVTPAWVSYMEVNNSMRSSLISCVLIILFYPAGNIANAISTWLIVAMTVTRFTSIQSPKAAAKVNSKHFTRIVTGVVISGAVALNITRMMEVWVATCIDIEYNKTRYVVTATQLRLNRNYISYYLVIIYNGVIFIIPTAILFIFNTIIIQSLNKRTITCNLKHPLHSIVDQYCNDDDDDERNVDTADPNAAQLGRNTEERTKKFTGLLLGAISALFFLCNILPCALNVAEETYPQFFGTLHSSTQHDALTDVSNLLVCLHSSLNFIIFLLFSKYFRRAIKSRLRVAHEHLPLSPQAVVRPFQPAIVTTYERWRFQPRCCTPITAVQMIPVQKATKQSLMKSKSCHTFAPRIQPQYTEKSHLSLRKTTTQNDIWYNSLQSKPPKLLSGTPTTMGGQVDSYTSRFYGPTSSSTDSVNSHDQTDTIVAAVLPELQSSWV